MSHRYHHNIPILKKWLCNISIHLWKFFYQSKIQFAPINFFTDCFGIVFNDCFGKQINDIYNMPVLNAHNEFLQYLISNGIFGVLSYSALYFTVIYDEITNPKKHVSDINVFMPVCAYLGQALINNPHMMNYIVLFLFISIIQKNRQQL